jgi:hypothetical protein
MADTRTTFIATIRSMLQDELKDLQQGRMVIKIDDVDVSAKRRSELAAHIEHATKVLNEEENAPRP